MTDPGSPTATPPSGAPATVLAAVGAGVAVLLAGNLPWLVLGNLNQRLGPALPWAVVPMAGYLALYWRFLDGRSGPPGDRLARRGLLRANRLSPGLWLGSLGTGLVGFAAILAFLAVAARLTRLPPGDPIPTPPGMPATTLLTLLVTQSAVAGITEEAAFRGYLQSLIERRLGPVVAIAFNGLSFGLLHFANHPGGVVVMLPYYLFVSAVYGALTWAADSILPALVLHVAGDIVVLIRWWATGLPEWQLTAAAPPVIADHGIDGGFVLAGTALLSLTAATAWGVAGIRRRRLALSGPATTGRPQAPDGPA